MRGTNRIATWPQFHTQMVIRLPLVTRPSRVEQDHWPRHVPMPLGLPGSISESGINAAEKLLLRLSGAPPHEQVTLREEGRRGAVITEDQGLRLPDRHQAGIPVDAAGSVVIGLGLIVVCAGPGKQDCFGHNGQRPATGLHLLDRTWICVPRHAGKLLADGDNNHDQMTPMRPGTRTGLIVRHPTWPPRARGVRGRLGVLARPRRHAPDHFVRFADGRARVVDVRSLNHQDGRTGGRILRGNPGGPQGGGLGVRTGGYARAGVHGGRPSAGPKPARPFGAAGGYGVPADRRVRVAVAVTDRGRAARRSAAGSSGAVPPDVIRPSQRKAPLAREAGLQRHHARAAANPVTRRRGTQDRTAPSAGRSPQRRR